MAFIQFLVTILNQKYNIVNNHNFQIWYHKRVVIQENRTKVGDLVEYQIDELDRGIIRLLSKDGRIPFSEIANKLNVTEKTVRLRYKNLVQNDIIEVVGVVNPIALGLKAGAIIQIKTAQGRCEQVMEELKTMKEVRFITMTSGPYPLLIQINVQSQEDIRESILQLDKIEGIVEINTIIQLENYKNTFEYI
ncbi:Lrp/AsnC family transcriptional regulator, regulator for asnA, asnC and gidA [Sediminibacillus halophilus]|uniref:Lrp/AsnC family transcriptional regulator, regulator for asnA, asnC and gidA n=1 Tax=Sediminibacillus halophilus TaxID=482461 RepID=A0A1G9RXS5_9BACI|nr:Lrp/AsnC family transcriptional regulator, regulator for asnA, asnC and gidA [Sediminibacillus halophilus]